MIDNLLTEKVKLAREGVPLTFQAFEAIEIFNLTEQQWQTFRANRLLPEHINFDEGFSDLRIGRSQFYTLPQLEIWFNRICQPLLEARGDLTSNITAVAAALQIMG